MDRRGRFGTHLPHARMQGRSVLAKSGFDDARKMKSAGSPIQPEFGAVFPFGHGLSYTAFQYMDFQVKRVTFTVPVDLLAVATSATRRVVEPGEFELMIGRSSADIVFRTTIEVTGKPRELPGKWRMKTEARESGVGE